MIFNKLSADKRNEILLMAQNNKLVAVALDNNGKYWSIGISRGAYMTSGTATSGVAYADRSGYELVISGLEPQPAFEVLSTIMEA